jgi:hypothetical protein
MLTTHDSSSATTTTARDSLHTLDTLARRSSDELDALYRAATDGQLVGRMLAIRGMPTGIGRALGRWAKSDSFVWEGKTFSATSDTRGVGHNRIFVPGVFGRQNLFPFETLFGPSAIDGRPTLILDYDLRVNPPWIRRIHDEVREVSPGLFLGPAMWKGSRAKSLVLWFALDSRLS